jgi:hypothetical protein
VTKAPGVLRLDELPDGGRLDRYRGATVEKGAASLEAGAPAGAPARTGRPGTGRIGALSGQRHPAATAIR